MKNKLILLMFIFHYSAFGMSNQMGKSLKKSFAALSYNLMYGHIADLAEMYKEFQKNSFEKVSVREWLLQHYLGEASLDKILTTEKNNFDEGQLLSHFFYKNFEPYVFDRGAIKFRFSEDGRYFAYEILKNHIFSDGSGTCFRHKWYVYDSLNRTLSLLDNETDAIPLEIREYEGDWYQDYDPRVYSTMSCDKKCMRSDYDRGYSIHEIKTGDILSFNGKQKFKEVFFDRYRPRVAVVQPDQEDENKHYITICSYDDNCLKMLYRLRCLGSCYTINFLEFSPASQRYIIASNGEGYHGGKFNVYDLQGNNDVYGLRKGGDHCYSHCEIVGNGDILFYKTINRDYGEAHGYVFDMHNKKVLIKFDRCIDLWMVGSQIHVLCSKTDEIVNHVVQSSYYELETYRVVGTEVVKEDKKYKAYSQFTWEQSWNGSFTRQHKTVAAKLYLMSQPGYFLNVIEQKLKIALQK